MVRSNTFEIRWHDTQPIFSCDFQSIRSSSLIKTLDINKLQAEAAAQLEGDQSAASSSTKAAALTNPSQSWRFATAGADNQVRVWMVYPNIPSPAALAGAASSTAPLPPRVEFLSTLSRHTHAVNAVKFSPSGENIGTAGDDGFLMIWSLSNYHVASIGEEEEATYAKETWKPNTTLKITPSELYDLAWSPNGEAIAAGGTDFVVRIIDVAGSCVIREILEHSLHVQGVAWDPLNEFLATQSADRSVHVFNLHTKFNSSTQTHQGLPGTPQSVSKNTKMELHKRSGSFGGVGNSNTNHGNGSSSSSALAGPSTSSHSNAESASSASAAGGSGTGTNFIWDLSARPPMQRRGSSVSHASESGGERDNTFPPGGGRSGRSSTPSSIIGATPGGSNSNFQVAASIPAPVHGVNPTSAAVAPGARPGTPTPSIPQSPFSTASAVGGAGIPHAMNPPQRTPSRRSSFSGSNAEIEPGSPPTSTTSFAPSSMARLASGGAPITGHEAANAAATNGTTGSLRNARSSSVSTQGGGGGENLARSVRSSSPMPPLPAIRAPPSPKQRLQAAQAQLGSGAGKGMLARVQLYGDEHFTGFFRRLNFSPDGALLVTPAGTFDAPQAPSSPTFSPHAVASSSGKKGSSSGATQEVPPIPGLASTSDLNSSASARANAASAAGRSTVYLYGRGNFGRNNSPLAHLPGHKTASIVVKFNPILYELRNSNPDGNAGADGGTQPHQTVPLEVGREKRVNIAPPPHVPSRSNGKGKETVSGANQDAPEPSTSKRAKDSSGESNQSSHPNIQTPKSMIGLPYRMIFAVATYDSVWIYDTQQTGPLCCFSNMHYAAFTDLAWSPDGQTLMMSSTDGYCSIAVFDYNELGIPYQYSSQPSLKAPVSGTVAPILHAQGIPSTPASTSNTNSNSASASQVHPHATHAQSPLGLGLNVGAPASTSTSTDPKASTSQASDSTDQPKKKRRIAPTIVTNP